MSDRTETATVSSSGSAIPGVHPSGLTQSSIPSVGVYRTGDHQYFVNGMGPYFNVTRMLDIIWKEALARWFKQSVADFAVSSLLNGALVKVIEKDGPEGARKWLAAMPDQSKNTAARLGTSVHHLADLLGRDRKPVEGFGISEGTLPYAQAVAAFLDEYGRSNIVSSEKAVINFSEGYAGTYDFLLLLNGELWLCDWKTSKGLYPETALQLAAYGHAEYIVLPNDPTLYPMPQIQRYGVVHVRPDQYAKGYRFVEYQVRDRDYRAFLAARDLWAWREEGRFKQKDAQTVAIPIEA